MALQVKGMPRRSFDALQPLVVGNRLCTLAAAGAAHARKGARLAEVTVQWVRLVGEGREGERGRGEWEGSGFVCAPQTTAAVPVRKA